MPMPQPWPMGKDLAEIPPVHLDPAQILELHWCRWLLHLRCLLPWQHSTCPRRSQPWPSDWHQAPPDPH
ncbi:hypothetical protein SORBI_3009G216200 [Sorghum bicolor]|nr:hypothetical protein SORBI_3009G216200 [Sorghum bicolor]